MRGVEPLALPQWYWVKIIRDERDFRQHVDYIHFNPVKHGLVTSEADWPHSTFSAYVQRGLYPLDWGGGSLPNDCPGAEGFDSRLRQFDGLRLRFHSSC